LSSTLPGICVLFFLRRTHMGPITTICAMRFSAPILPQFAGLNRHLMTCLTVSYIPAPFAKIFLLPF
jgi:hypothetical protein